MASASRWGQWAKHLYHSSVFTADQTHAIEEAVANSPERQKQADELANENDSVGLQGLFKSVLGGLRAAKRERNDMQGFLSLLNASEARELEFKQMLLCPVRSLDDAETRKITVPDAGHYTLGNIRSHLVNWRVREALDLDGREEWWNQLLSETRKKLKELNLEVSEADREEARLQYDTFMNTLARVYSEVCGYLKLEGEVTYEVDQLASTGTTRQFPDGTLNFDGGEVMSVQAKSKTEDPVKQDKLIAEARGQIVKRANDLYAGTETSSRRGREFHGIVTTGLDVQAVVVTHEIGRKPKGVLTPLKRLLRAKKKKKKQRGPVRFEVGEKYPVDVDSEAMEFLIYHCYENASKLVKMRAAAEAEKFQSWRDGDVVRLKMSSGFKVGETLVNVLVGDSPVLEEVEAEVMSELKVSPGSRSMVRPVKWKKEKWWLKLGPDRDERQVEMNSGCSWEEWFQVERDAMCHQLVGDLVAIPVEVQGMNRPAMLVEDAGVSLADKMQAGGIEPEEVLEMSKQVFQTLARAFNTHGLFHNDVAPRNICFKDGVYRLVDWGMAQGELEVLRDAVEQAWPRAFAGLPVPPLVNWLLAPNRALFYLPARDLVDCIESLVYCCMLLLNGGERLPWSCGCEAILELRQQALERMIQEPSRNFIHAPLLHALLEAKGVTGATGSPCKKMRRDEAVDPFHHTCVPIMGLAS